MNPSDTRRRRARGGRPVADWLSSLSADSEVARHAGRLIDLQAWLDHCTPATLRTPLTVMNLRTGTLVATAPNGALAHRARLAAPKILEALRTREPGITSLRIEVQREFAQPPAPKKEAQLSPVARTSLRQLADSLPESDVRAALERLLDRKR